MAILTAHEMKNLLEALSGEKECFANCFDNFHKLFPKPADHFKGACGIWLMLEQNMLSLTQRLIALYILWEICHQNDGADSSSRRHLFDIVMCSQIFHARSDRFLKKPERTLVLRFLQGVTKTMREETVADFVSRVASDEFSGDQRALEDECYRQLKKVVESFPRGEGSQAQGVLHVVPDYSLEEAKLHGPQKTGVTANQDFATLDFTPNFVRVVPEPTSLETCSGEELAGQAFWLSPGVHPELQWDYNMGSDFNKARELLLISMGEKLPDAQERFVVDFMKQNFALAYFVGMTPETWVRIAERNPQVAAHVIVSLSNSKHITIQRYWDKVLKEVKNPINAMEIMNELTCHVKIEQDMLLFFVNSMIEQCRTWNEQDRPRLVRLLHAYLTSQFKENIILVTPDLHKVLDAFLLEFEDKKLKKIIDRKLQEQSTSSSPSKH